VGLTVLAFLLLFSQDFKAHTKNLIENLRQEYAEGVRTINGMMSEQKHGRSEHC
jgi:hypothetical protein